MCGIAGIWNRGGRPLGPEELQRFARSLSHRGPDGEGYFFDKEKCLGLAHRRLAILDLSEGAHQPLQFGEGRYWITLNGEIYNFIELRKTLESAGYVFRTQSDTEVIPAAYDYWGPDCQLKFNGMWAFAIWDTLKQTLFVSRDRFGIKPLLYLHNADRFAFASEMKAFLHLEAFSPEENTAALRRVIGDPMSLEGTEDCLLKGLKRLPAGHCMNVAGGTRWIICPRCRNRWRSRRNDFRSCSWIRVDCGCVAMSR